MCRKNIRLHSYPLLADMIIKFSILHISIFESVFEKKVWMRIWFCQISDHIRSVFTPTYLHIVLAAEVRKGSILHATEKTREGVRGGGREVGTLTQIDQHRGYYPNKIRHKTIYADPFCINKSKNSTHWHSIMTPNCDSEQQAPKKGH